MARGGTSNVQARSLRFWLQHQEQLPAFSGALEGSPLVWESTTGPPPVVPWIDPTVPCGVCRVLLGLSVLTKVKTLPRPQEVGRMPEQPRSTLFVN